MANDSANLPELPKNTDWLEISACYDGAHVAGDVHDHRGNRMKSWGQTALVVATLLGAMWLLRSDLSDMRAEHPDMRGEHAEIRNQIGNMDTRIDSIDRRTARIEGRLFGIEIPAGDGDER